MEIAQVIKKAGGYNISGYLVIDYNANTASVMYKAAVCDFIKRGLISNAALQYYNSSTIIRVKDTEPRIVFGSGLANILCTINSPVGIVANFRGKDEAFLYIGMAANKQFQFMTTNQGVMTVPPALIIDSAKLNTGGVRATFCCKNYEDTVARMFQELKRKTDVAHKNF